MASLPLSNSILPTNPTLKSRVNIQRFTEVSNHISIRFMANKTILLADKQLVTERLATGMSTRQAIEGTSIASNKTAALLAKHQSHIITQLRSEYLEAINHYAAEKNFKAAMLADMVWANKTIRKPVPKYYDRMSGRLTYEETLVEVPDWEARLKAIKYIDQIAGLVPMGGMRINVLQHVGS